MEIETYIREVGCHRPQLGFIDTDFTLVFRSIQLPYNQLEVANIISNYLQGINCSTLAAIADGCVDTNRGEVLGVIMNKVQVMDRQNKAILQNKLSQFQFIVIESKYFSAN